MEKKKNTGLIIGAAAVVFFVIAAVAVFFVGRAFGRSPQIKMKMVAANLAIEAAKYYRPISGQIDFDTIDRLRETGTIHTDTDVSITIPDSEINNVSIHVDALTNKSLKKANYDIGVGMYGFEMPFADVAATSDTLYIALPQFLKDTYSVGLTKLGEEFNDSEWSSFLDTELPEDYSITLFDTNDNEGAYGELAEIFRDSSKEFRESIVLDNIREPKDGYRGVRLTVPCEVVNRYLETLGNNLLESEFYAAYIEELMKRADGARLKEISDTYIEQISEIRLKTDYVLDFYFDRQWRLMNVSTPSDMETADGTLLAVDIDFLGEERVLDVIEGGIYVKSGEKINYLGIERNASVSDTLYHEDIKLLLQTNDHDKDITFSYTNDMNKEDISFDAKVYIDVPDGTACFTVDGAYEDVVQGERYTLRINNASLSLDDEELFYVSMVKELEPSDEELEIPEDSIDLLGMNTNEIQKMIYEALGSIRNFNYE